ncbi:hypothetical protein ABPG72_001306 [Tetrahymena utriculariae]
MFIEAFVFQMDLYQFIIAIAIALLSTLLFFKYRSNKYKKLTPTQRKAFLLLTQGQIAEFKKCLEENQIDPNLQDFQNLHLLHCAVGLCNRSEQQGIEAIKYLLEKGAKINCLDQSGRTPILMASNWNIYPAVDLLCSLNADLNETVFHHGYPVNPLYFVLQRGNYEMAWYLIQKGSSIEKIDETNSKSNQFKLGAAQLEFLEKCKLTLKRIENKKRLCLARTYQEIYVKKIENQENKIVENSEKPSIILSMLNKNEFNEICKYYL